MMICFKTLQRYKEKCKLQSRVSKIILKALAFLLFMPDDSCLMKKNTSHSVSPAGAPGFFRSTPL